jgi:hypothetical protein
MTLPADLRRSTQKHSDKLLSDPFFQLRVKAIYQTMRTIAPERDAQNAKAEAYVLACILEDSYEDGLRFG